MITAELEPIAAYGLTELSGLYQMRVQLCHPCRGGLIVDCDDADEGFKGFVDDCILKC